MTPEQENHPTALKTYITNMLGRTGLNGDEASIELSTRRTGISFQRTRMSADRTLMSVIRTSLALISFGFTIFQFFRSLRDAGTASDTVHNAARNFSTTLIIVGVAMLVFGLGFHLSFMRALRAERKAMVEIGMLHGDLPYPVSLTMVTAVVLLLVGLIMLVGVFLRTGPFV